VGAAQDAELGANPVEVALTALVLDGHRHLLAQERSRSISVDSHSMSPRSGRPAQLLLSGHALEQQRLGRRRGREPDLAVERIHLHGAVYPSTALEKATAKGMTATSPAVASRIASAAASAARVGVALTAGFPLLSGHEPPMISSHGVRLAVSVELAS
jgi:hypothetical protein